ncbi:MAG: outer membrane beta-barrel protein [Bradymonadaceae bacterium]
MSRLKSMLAVVLFVVGCCIPSVAFAGGFAFSVGQDLGVIPLAGAESVTNTGTRIGYQTGNLHLFGTLDYARFNQKQEFATGGNGGTDEFTNTFGLLTVGAGGRYFFSEPVDVKHEALPYVVGSIYTVLPHGEVNDRDLFKNLNKFTLGGQAGFGTDYFFTEQFSIGGEFGFSAIYGSVSPDNADSSASANLIQFYSGIQFSFYL